MLSVLPRQHLPKHQVWLTEWRHRPLQLFPEPSALKPPPTTPPVRRADFCLSAAFDRVQLGRKLIRLDRIIAHADSELQMQCRLVLVAPKKPNFKDKEGNEYKSWISFAKGLPEKRAKEFEVMNAALSEIKSNIGDEIHFMQLTEYPEKLYAVERQRETKSKEGAYTHCILKLRKPTKDAT